MIEAKRLSTEYGLVRMSRRCNIWCMTERKRKVFSATVPEWLIKEVSASYGNVSEFTERALQTQLQLDRQLEAIEVLAGQGKRAKGREVLKAVEAEPGYAARAAQWDRERDEDRKAIARVRRPSAGG